MALTCGQCNAGFCGWCLADCGNDAHNHVARCSAKPPGADVYYATDAEYVSEPLMPMPKSRVLLRSLGLSVGCNQEAAWRARRQTLLDKYFAESVQDPEVRDPTAK